MTQLKKILLTTAVSVLSLAAMNTIAQKPSYEHNNSKKEIPPKLFIGENKQKKEISKSYMFRNYNPDNNKTTTYLHRANEYIQKQNVKGYKTNIMCKK